VLTSCCCCSASSSSGVHRRYRQKGTGRARHGSNRVNIFRGGAKAHGPVPRDHSYRLPRKVRQMALRVVLSAKLDAGELLIVEDGTLASVRAACTVWLSRSVGP
jgi:large subunit ribosomal protein L4